jgi:hypothetical protein
MYMFLLQPLSNWTISCLKIFKTLKKKKKKEKESPKHVSSVKRNTVVVEQKDHGISILKT